MSDAEARFILLAQVAKSDGVICGHELRTAIAMFAELGLPEGHARTTMTKRIQSVTADDVDSAVDALIFARARERERTIQLMWVMAICDGDLHPEQERFIYATADRLGVARRTLALQQPDISRTRLRRGL